MYTLASVWSQLAVVIGFWLILLMVWILWHKLRPRGQDRLDAHIDRVIKQGPIKDILDVQTKASRSSADGSSTIELLIKYKDQAGLIEAKSIAIDVVGDRMVMVHWPSR